MQNVECIDKIVANIVTTGAHGHLMVLAIVDMVSTLVYFGVPDDVIESKINKLIYAIEENYEVN